MYIVILLVGFDKLNNFMVKLVWGNLNVNM